MRLIFDWLLRALAVVALSLMFATAAHNVSTSYDVWYYHMPFAARLTGIVGPDTFLFHPANTEHFKGFPLLGEFIQGVLWRVTDRPESANLLAFFCVPVFAFFLRRFFAVPFHISVLALLAIPLVHTHSVDSHVDLPASTAAAALLLITIRAFASRELPSVKVLALAAAAATFAINTKAVVGPVVLGSIALLGLRTLFLWRRLPDSLKRRYRSVIVGFALLLPVVFATPIKNSVLYQNPIYPFQLQIFGLKLPGAEEEYASSPVWLQDSSRPTRFAASVLEMGLRSYADPARWTVGQWTPKNHPGLRMGGFFGAYAVLHVAMLVFRLFRERSRAVRAAAAGFGLVTLLTSLMPQSHELRYYLYWMMLLVAINLWLSSRPAAPAFGSVSLGAVAALALGVVLYVTRAAYATPTGATFPELVRARVKPSSVAKIQDGETVCVQREPYNFLWAARFHPPRNYVVQSAQVESDCNGHRRIEAPARRRRRGR